MKLPPTGMPRAAVMDALDQAAAQDADWRGGRTWSLVYFAGDEVLQVAKDAYLRFFSENGLSPMAFPSLRRFENQVLSMALQLFHAPDGAGSMTTGGSESVLMAVKTARDWARQHKPAVRNPQVLLPVTAHPAFRKAAHYFGVTTVDIPLDAGFRADAAAARGLVTEDTILVVGSAPAYPHGVMDPIAELAQLAASRGILCHVDSCLGGYLLPFAEKLGHPVPPFDFRVPGVTSLSADLHKYGYAAKGASTILYRTRELRQFQYFTHADWPGGLYGSPSMTGTRAGGAIAAAWAVMNHLGEEGYLRLSKQVLDTARDLREGVAAVPGLRVLGEPPFSVFAFGSDVVDVYALGDAMEARGWRLDRQQLPPCLHMMVTPAHREVVQPFLADLRACVQSLTAGVPAPEGSAAMYGMLGALPERGAVGSFILQFMDSMDTDGTP